MRNDKYVPPSIQNEILEFLADRLEKGNRYVKAHLVASEIDSTGRQAGIYLSALEDRSYLDRWTETSGGIVWQITDHVTEYEPVEVGDVPACVQQPGFGYTQRNVILTVDAADSPLTGEEIADRMDYKRGVISSTIVSLCRKGLLEAVNPDSSEANRYRLVDEARGADDTGETLEGVA